jgi:hypothetical protein
MYHSYGMIVRILRMNLLRNTNIIVNNKKADLLAAVA